MGLNQYLYLAIHSYKKVMCYCVLLDECVDADAFRRVCMCSALLTAAPGTWMS